MPGGLGDIDGVLVGHATDGVGLTGCTAVIFPEGAVAGHVVCGVASGSRELAALTPRHLVERIHGICFSGGSAFGLAAASGVMHRLEAEGIGHATSFAAVPIVAGAVVYDLNLGSARARPDETMGIAAAEEAFRDAPIRSGNVGAGTGVCAGKLLGVTSATKTGLGNAGLCTEDGLQVAALVVLNPVGDVLQPGTGALLAGARKASDSLELAGTAFIIRGGAVRAEPLTPNTTLAVVATNALLSRVEAEWVAEQAAVALARLIDPPFTRHDGDVVFCASVGMHASDLHRVGLLCREALIAAIVDACLSAEAAGGLPCSRDLSH
jgi:L-aminopeptidase/D-esterase-like protein